MYDANEKNALEKTEKFGAEILKYCVKIGGVLTGEHGVGLHKKAYLLQEHGDCIPLMKTIKKSIDQNNIMNPGKIFDLN